MGLRLEIVSQQRHGLGEIKAMVFGQDGGTIGRSLKNDWALPDKQRFMSARHASIDYRSGSYYIIDTSTNGVYVNESETPVGRGKPQRLFDGDRIRIGDYIMIAKIEEDESVTAPLHSSDHVDPVDLAERVESPELTGVDLIDAHEITGVGFEIMLDDESGSHEASTVALEEVRLDDKEDVRQTGDAYEDAFELELEAAVEQASKAEKKSRTTTAGTGKPTPVQQMLRDAPADSAKTPATANTKAGAPTTALEAFFRGAGLAEQTLDEAQTRTMLFLVGQILRELLTGLAENLHVRSQHKSALRLTNTTIQKVNNNPLKFSAGAGEALTNLLFRESKEYLGPVEAVRDAFADVNSHQRSLMKAMQHAVNAYMGRLNPGMLEEKFDRATSKRASKEDAKSRYWELYREMYQALAQHSDGQLPAQFIEELARAYEAQHQRETEMESASAPPKARTG